MKELVILNKKEQKRSMVLGIFERSKREPKSLEKQFEGRRNPTQFGRLMEELGVTSISSRSPQARGRIEQLWGTFQDRTG